MRSILDAITEERDMARYVDAATLVKTGNSPGQIAKLWGISCSSVAQYLYTAVGRRLISRSDIFFMIDEETAEAVESIIEQNGIRNRRELEEFLRLEPVTKRDDLAEALLYFDLREAPLADMYESLCKLERFLHRYIKIVLEEHFGPESWWDELPLAIRKQCAEKRQEDPVPERQHEYCYTTFIDLHDIFKKHWPHLSRNFPGSVRADRNVFLSELQKLNGIRNRIMHPVHEYMPAREDFESVRKFTGSIFAETSGSA
jgi:predicted transcriptional regulator